LAGGSPAIRGTQSTPQHKRFRDAYQAKFNDYRDWARSWGTTLFSGRGASQTGSTPAGGGDEGLTFDSPFGRVTFRALDHQSTMGAYVGRTAVKDGKGVMVDWRYADGKDYLPSDEQVKRLRPAD
jgi:branched-chain amino acid transport system substrate-binding protein